MIFSCGLLTEMIVYGIVTYLSSTLLQKEKSPTGTSRAFQGCRDMGLLSVNKQGCPDGGQCGGTM
jgi:hypothetical protein